MSKNKFYVALKGSSAGVLGAVYTCDFPYKSPYDSVYDLLPMVSSKLIFDFFWLKCVNELL
jgi:hypothetical protein